MTRNRSTIDVASALGSDLLSVEKPARYVGGELGAIARQGSDGEFLVGLSFPDLYEIGMSNNAIRILYSGLNGRDGVRCERVFAPAPDMEALLRARELPLFTLESHTALKDLDLLAISLGYELAATSILAILDTGRIPLHVADRGKDDPLVIMGGPAISNPHPFGDFIEAAYIGEAEASFFDLVEELGRLKRAGADRLDLLAKIAEDPAVWLSPSAKELLSAAGRSPSQHKAIRAIYTSFPEGSYSTAFPVATMKTVQDHGTVEIMRGCPNGCRFCHAGYYYRPQRVKPFAAIREEVRTLVEKGGYRAITLASLSSGDYPGIDQVLDALNAEWAGRGVSFQLPSLKISSFTLPILEKLSEVRKSGLTFAVETPNDAWQRIINKDVSFAQTAAILKEAKAHGFRLAKFYFMIGLPVPGGVEAEVDNILEFFDRLLAEVPMQLNVNIGTFVPKPFTPFQWAPALSEEASLAAIFRLKDGLRKHRGLKVSYHSPFVSMLEGVISRGDERVGQLIEAAYRRGARLDAWEEHFNRDLWREVLSSAPWDPVHESLKPRDVAEALPWDDISIRVSKKWLLAEHSAALEGKMTRACSEDCTDLCGSCGANEGIVHNSGHVEAPPAGASPLPESAKLCRLLFEFTKKDFSRFYPHLALVEAISKAFQILELPVLLSEGFNPLPRLELSNPLGLGIETRGDFASMLMKADPFTVSPYSDPARLASALNAYLPEGVEVGRMEVYPIFEGKKIFSIASLSWGAEYLLSARAGESDTLLESLFVSLTEAFEKHGFVEAHVSLAEDKRRLGLVVPNGERKEEGIMRILEACLGGPAIQKLEITRVSCLAKGQHEQGYRDYFEAFAALAKAQAQ